MPENRSVRELYNEYLRGNATLEDVDQVARRVIARFAPSPKTSSSTPNRGTASGTGKPTT